MSTTIAVEYVWCSGANPHHDLRTKVKSVSVSPADVQGFVQNPASLLQVLPVWNFDGSSTGQAMGKDTEILIQPVAVFPHPFLKGVPAFVAIAECFLPSGEPTPDNTRFIARSVFDDEKAKGQEPWFGLEQEYVLYRDGRPLGWPSTGEPAPQGPYYCSTGALVAHGRKFAERHYVACLNMGLKISGTNAEVMPGQWEYQVGPCEGIESGDHLLLSRWAFLRMLEDEGIDVNFDAKPKKGDWNGSGMHCNFSTKAMREDGGMAAIDAAIANLAKTFHKDVAVYGIDNNQRLSGHHETSRLDTFNYDVGTRNTSLRIPNETKKNSKGYFEDRRPAASSDGYLVTSRLFASSCNIPAPLLDAHGERVAPDWLRSMANKQA